MVLAEQILSVYDQAPYFPTRDFPINPGEVSIAVLGTSGNPPQAPLLKGNGQSRFTLYCLLPSRVSPFRVARRHCSHHPYWHVLIRKAWYPPPLIRLINTGCWLKIREVRMGVVCLKENQPVITSHVKSVIQFQTRAHVVEKGLFPLLFGWLLYGVPVLFASSTAQMIASG